MSWFIPQRPLGDMGLAASAGENLLTDTRKVCVGYEKRHDDVLRLTLRRIAEAGDCGVRNFAETIYTDPQNGQT